MKSKGYINYLKRKRNYAIKVFLTQFFLIILFLILWQFLTDKKIIDSFLLSSPKKVYNTIISLYKDNNLFNHIFITFYEIIISFIIGNILGLLISSILWFNKFLSKVFDPFLTIINSLPKVAFGPLIIVCFGANINSIIIMSLLISLIISIISITNAFSSSDKNKIKLLQSFGANKYQIYKYLILPGNKNKIIETFKLNISMCFVGTIMGELLVSKEGIGYLIIYGSQIFNMNLVITGVVLLIIITIILYIIVNYFEKISRN